MSLTTQGGRRSLGVEQIHRKMLKKEPRFLSHSVVIPNGKWSTQDKVRSSLRIFLTFPVTLDRIPSSHQNLLGVQDKDLHVLISGSNGRGHPYANNHLCVVETPKKEFYLK